RDNIMNAVHISDGKNIMLKSISKWKHPFEVEMATFLCSPPLGDDPRNHFIPRLDVLQDPVDTDKEILVTPLLMDFDLPIVDTGGEGVACFHQIFEGIQFMHENFVAHRNCRRLNVVLDPSELYPYGTHPGNPSANLANDGLACSPGGSNPPSGTTLANFW
ncbi:hypothetical protein DFH07DRAFT_743744, partial [Mycena maculata]